MSVENLELKQRGHSEGRRVSFPFADENSRSGGINPTCSIEESSEDDASDPEIGFVEETSPPLRFSPIKCALTDAGAAIVVRDAEKAYSSGSPVLAGLNMTVPCGSIYGLLGSSGCGKTTMLSCLVGLRKLDHGDIWVFGKKPGTASIGVPGKNIGYMPQDISLYEEFTIGETLNYFGTLCGLDKVQVESGSKFLQSLLDLPEEKRRVETLSGGQKRRVSFATALIHDPELLILDEPTVGVDPIVRQNIWNHLGKLVSSKRTTVIITTHYIEEARQANNIGIMRQGRLLAERPPQQLMADCRETSLEKVVLRLCRKDTSLQITPRDMAEAIRRQNSSRDLEARKTPSPKRTPDVKMAEVLHEPQLGIRDTLVRIKAVTWKNFAILFRNLILLFFVLVVAASELALISTTVGGDPKRMRLGVVNNEMDYASCSNVTRIVGECQVESLSCHFLSKIPKDTVHLMAYETEADALAATQAGSAWGFITFPQNFSTLFYERSSSGKDDNETDLSASDIVTRMDESNKQITLPLKKTLYDAYEDFVGDFLFDCGYDRRQGESPLKYRKPIVGRADTDFREYISPSAGLALVFFFAIITTSIRLIKEKKCGMLERSLVHGIKTWEIMVAATISEFCVLAIQTALAYVVLTILIGIEIKGSHALVVLMFILSGYGGISFGFLLGTICTEEIQAAMLAMAAFFPNFILSGIIWPVEGMPPVLQAFVKGLPCTFSAEALRSIISRGWEFSHPHVWPGFVIFVGYICGFFLLTVIFLKVLRR